MLQRDCRMHAELPTMHVAMLLTVPGMYVALPTTLMFRANRLGFSGLLFSFLFDRRPSHELCEHSNLVSLSLVYSLTGTDQSRCFFFRVRPRCSSHGGADGITDGYRDRLVQYTIEHLESLQVTDNIIVLFALLLTCLKR